MARPTYSSGQPMAKDRLRKAFWDVLACEKYDRITVKAVSSKAEVNPNTFYYHYANMDELAKDALDAEKIAEIPLAMREYVTLENRSSLEDALSFVTIGDRWKKIRLFVNSESATLHRFFYETFESVWLSLLGIRKEDLSKEDALDLAFIINGAISVIGLQSEDYDMSYLASFSERPLGKGVMEAINELSKKHAAKSIERE